MQLSRRFFLRRTAGVLSLLVGGAQLMASAAPTGATPPADPQPAPSVPAQPTGDGTPRWQDSPTIEFVEGIPATVSIRQFVLDSDQDPLVIQLKTGTFLPGIIWNPSNATIAYDGHPLGAKPQEPVVLTGITFSVDDGKS